MSMFVFLCDRCGRGYRTQHFPSQALCRSCHLGALPSPQRALSLVKWGGR